MELESIVANITREVLSRVMLQTNEEIKMKSQDTTMEKKQILVLIPYYAINVNEQLEYITQKNEDCKLLIIDNQYVEQASYKLNGDMEPVRIKSDLEKQKIINSFNKLEAVYCISPGIKLMEAIANMDDRDFIEHIVINSLLHKKHVNLLFDYNIDDLGVNRLTQKARELINNIISMGACVETTFPEDSRNTGSKSEKGLISEKDIDEMKNEGRNAIYCQKGCIITPLALDRAKEVGITVIFKDR